MNVVCPVIAWLLLLLAIVIKSDCQRRVRVDVIIGVLCIIDVGALINRCYQQRRSGAYFHLGIGKHDMKWRITHPKITRFSVLC